MKKVKITDLVLGVLYGIGSVMECFSFTRSDIWNSINGTDFGHNWSKRQFSTTLNNLHKSGYVKYSGENNQSVEFTSKAKLRIIDRIAEKIVTDSHFRFVSFDIPEYMRKQRDAFRRAIKKLGFKQIQKSLWVINKNVGDLVELAAYEYKVEKYVIYIASNKSDIDGLLLKKFV